jgi:hypothetical protein
MRKFLLGYLTSAASRVGRSAHMLHGHATQARGAFQVRSVTGNPTPQLVAKRRFKLPGTKPTRRQCFCLEHGPGVDPAVHRETGGIGARVIAFWDS